MPNMDGGPIDRHYDVTPAERRVLRLVAAGESDADIEVGLDMTAAAVHSVIRRFRERTGLAGRALAAGCRQHRECCISIAK
jgi:DNA-binding CsgD family transcriptional regulator